MVHGLPSHGAQAQRLWRSGTVAPQHVGSQFSGDQTHVPCIARQVLNHWTTREVPTGTLFKLHQALSSLEQLSPLLIHLVGMVMVEITPLS